ncbi:hypothetical protein PVAND_003920 [Polypedilum vanderplanki]|uniref:Uncharacterized protein n=1 Tax=Polypedilum vanderplanki TaxID=319348 RepID=A0A9J6BVI4_POLVA|nr:hypothetical protein PVAND_003920 [Polypedilum vanderplanki]
MLLKSTIPIAVLLLFIISTDAQQTRKVRLRQRPIQIESAEEETSDEVIQYYRPQAKQDNAQELVYVSEDEYQNLYAQAQQTTSRPRDYRPAVTSVRPLPRVNHSPTTLAPRTKINEEKAAPVQTIRNYNKVNDDGSFTFGYEAADGSFKEETRGTDCVVRGKYGYIDPDGNKREFTYVSGNPCDPNNPDGEEEDEERVRNQSLEDQDENIPQNYPRRPPVTAARPRPIVPSTTRAPTTVFQNRYNAAEEEEEAIQYAQIPKTTPRPPQFIQQTQRPRIQVIQTTPAPTQTVSYASPTPSVNITPKPLYKIQNNNVLSIQQTQEPATTYRPHTVSIVTQKPAVQSTPAAAQFIPSKSVTFGSSAQRGSSSSSIDFDAEFKKFQQETGFQPITPSSASPQTTKVVKIPSASSDTTANPIYQTQLVYNPSTGQYDSALYQTIPQTDGDFQLNQRIQPYVQQYQPQQQQYQPQPQTIYRPQPQPAAAVPQSQSTQVPQQIYQKQQNELQFINSQQLFAQQLQMQQSQLQRDRIEAAKKQQSHRFQLQNAEPSPILTGQLRAQPGQQYYYLQPSTQGGGQIDAFLRGHNIEY